jgi:hypothetical protein
MKYVVTLLLASALATPASAQLYAGVETSPAKHIRISDLSGFPSPTWTSGAIFDVSGAAARPDGKLYLCNGAFTTKLYRMVPGSSPTFVSTLSEDMSSLAFGRGKLYGYSNFASTKGIYEIDPATGAASLVLDTYTGPGFRFFALDYNPFDDLFYGYTEYGDAGLYSINIDTGVMTKLAGTIPASNGQGRGMAVGNNTVYLTATRGDAGIPYFSYELAQGVGGAWVGFTNAYPNSHSTGGAAFVAGAAPLTPDTWSISVASGGAQVLSLDASPAHAGSIYLMLGSLSGTTPGILLDGQLLPLAVDSYLISTLVTPNSPNLTPSLGVLDPSGKGQCTVQIPAGLAALTGAVAHHAFLVLGPTSVTFTSNAVPLSFLP